MQYHFQCPSEPLHRPLREGGFGAHWETHVYKNFQVLFCLLLINKILFLFSNKELVNYYNFIHLMGRFIRIICFSSFLIYNLYDYLNRYLTLYFNILIRCSEIKRDIIQFFFFKSNMSINVLNKNLENVYYVWYCFDTVFANQYFWVV